MTHHIGYINVQNESRSPRRNSVEAGSGSRIRLLLFVRESRGGPVDVRRLCPTEENANVVARSQHFVTPLSTNRLKGKPILRVPQVQPIYRPFSGSRALLLSA